MGQGYTGPCWVLNFTLNETGSHWRGCREERYNLACFKRIVLTGNFKLDVQIGLERPVGKAIEVIQVKDGGSS